MQLHGMKGVSSLITSLPTFMGTFSFLGDELHMIDHGLGHLVCNLLDPQENSRFKVEGSNEYTFDVVQSNFFKSIQQYVEASKSTSPVSFNFSFDFKKGCYRDVDWQFFLLHIVPTMIIPNLKYQAAKKALISLVNACSISLQRSISASELEDMKR